MHDRLVVRALVDDPRVDREVDVVGKLAEESILDPAEDEETTVAGLGERQIEPTVVIRLGPRLQLADVASNEVGHMTLTIEEPADVRH